ncbi:PIN domain-containing protein [Rhizobium sp. LjRoot98]|uniref:PIN domain-containing protein n=1 Tax=Rhizobium sp. LjRoot98 TaxID=3342345 RepID=UPI003ECC9389
MSSKPTHQKAEPLKTRHVFFDTEVYKRAGFNLRNSQFKAFGEYHEAGRLSLHTTDITFAEVARQIGEVVTEKIGQLNKLRRDFGRMSQLTTDFPELPRLDASQLTQALWKGVLEVLVSELSSNHILAMQIAPRRIFEKYFAGEAPFTNRGSKEFPDAFIVEALADYCSRHGITMYVISGDSALRAAAASHPTLLPLASIDDLLASCAAEADIDLEPMVEAIFETPHFDDQLVAALHDQLGFVEGIYYGDLTDGTVREVFVDEVQAIDGYRLAAIDNKSLSLILDVPCVLSATIDYIYDDPDVDEGDGEYFTTATESSRSRATLKLYVRIDTATGDFKEAELLTKRTIFE